MANVKISQLPETNSPESAGLIPIVQNGTTYSTTPAALKTLVDAGVASFEGRTGAVTLESADVTGALGFTPADSATTITINGDTQSLASDRTWTVNAGLEAPTVTITPAFPATVVQNLYVPGAFKFNGNTYTSTQYVSDIFSDVQSGSAGAYYQSNRITALSTNAQVLGNVNINSFNFDGTLTSLSLPSVIYIGHNGFFGAVTIASDSFLTTFNMPNLVACGNFNLGGNQISSFDFSSLEYVSSTFSVTYLASATPVSFPELVTVSGAFNVYGFQSDTLSFPNLKYLGYTTNLQPTAGVNPQTLNFNSLEYIASTFDISMSNLTSFSLPNLKYMGNSYAANFYTALDQTSVDNVLVAFAALDGTAGTTLWNNGSIYIAGSNATPSATGLAAISTLNARGIAVNYNP